MVIIVIQLFIICAQVYSTVICPFMCFARFYGPVYGVQSDQKTIMMINRSDAVCKK